MGTLVSIDLSRRRVNGPLEFRLKDPESVRRRLIGRFGLSAASQSRTKFDFPIPPIEGSIPMRSNLQPVDLEKLDLIPDFHHERSS